MWPFPWEHLNRDRLPIETIRISHPPALHVEEQELFVCELVIQPIYFKKIIDALRDTILC
jgi:hypothetical protein